MSRIEEILSIEKEKELRAPIDSYIADIQDKIDALRRNGTAKVQKTKNLMQGIKTDKFRTKEDKARDTAKARGELEKALEVEKKNSAEVASLIKQAEDHLKAHYSKEVYQPVADACKKAAAKENEDYKNTLAKLKEEHEKEVSKLSASGTADKAIAVNDEKYVYKNRIFNAKMLHEQSLREIKDRRYEAFAHQYHLVY